MDQLILYWVSLSLSYKQTFPETQSSSFPNSLVNWEKIGITAWVFIQKTQFSIFSIR